MLLEVLLDAHQVGLGIVAELELLVDAHHLLGIVEVGKHQWHLGIAGHKDGSLVPMGIGAAGALGGDTDGQLGRRIEGIHDRLREVAMLATIHGNATQAAQQIAHREEEPGILHQETRLHAHRVYAQLTENEIPVAGVRRNDDNALVGHCEVDLEGPPCLLQYPTRKVHAGEITDLLVGGHELVHALDDILHLGTEVFAQLLLALLVECAAGLVVFPAVGKVLYLLVELVAHTINGFLLQQGGVNDDAVPFLDFALTECGFCKDALACDVATGIHDSFLDLSFTCHNDLVNKKN